MTKIPKVIHYCWFGKGEKSDLIKKCIKSWNNYASDYTIKEWNEENYNIKENIYVYEAYKNKKWAFVSDYVRMQALYEEGGIYLDTDVELFEKLDDFLVYPFFIGMHSHNEVQTALIGAQKKNKVIECFLNYYKNKHFILEDGNMDYKTNNNIITKILVDDFGLKLEDCEQILNNDIYIFPKSFFTEKSIGKKNYAKHYFNASWIPREILLEELKSYKENYFLCMKWLEKSIKGDSILKKLELKFNNIAIYGLGYLGRQLFNQATNENLKIKCIIDNGVMNNEYNGVKVIKPSQLSKEKLDLIIVTPVYDFNNIHDKLINLTNAKIMSLEQLL